MKITHERQVIGGIFSTRESADNAIEAFQELKISRHDILVIQLPGSQAVDSYTSFLVDRGFTHSQALYYDRAIQSGKILITVYEVSDLNTVIDVFRRFHAQLPLNNKHSYSPSVSNYAA